MATTYDKASLVMIPSGYKDDKLYSVKPTDGSGDFTFSRDGSGASPATRVNASGLIEKGRENLLPYSNTFNTGWSPVSGTLAQGVADPFGGNDAWSITATNTDPYLYNQTAWSGVATLSIWAKGVGSSIGKPIQLRMGGSFVEHILTSEWQRFEHFVSGSAANIGIEVPNPAVAGDVVHIYGAQLEYGLVATDYIETTTAPVSAGLLGDMPRLDYSGGATCPSLLLEPSRVNDIAQSEYFNAWDAINGVSGSVVPVITANYAQSPEGVQNAARVQFDKGSGTTDLFYSLIRWQGLSSSIRTYSVYMKSTDGSSTYNVALRSDNRETFEVTGEWQRFDITSDTAETYIQIGLRGTWGTSDTADILIYGAQAELGSYPTSYIPTYGSASTRGADVPTNLSASNLIGSDEGVMFLDLQTPSAIEVDMNFSISDGTGSNYARIEIRQDLSIDIRYRIGGSNQISGTFGSFTAGDRLKLAFAYKSGDSALYMNGTQLTTSSATLSSNSFDEIRYAFATGIVGIEGDVKQTLLFKTRLTNAELAALTTI